MKAVAPRARWTLDDFADAIRNGAPHAAPKGAQEALALVGERGEEYADSAYLHYLINTNEPLSGRMPQREIIDNLSAYGRQVGLTVSADERGRIHVQQGVESKIFDVQLSSPHELRRLGRELNRLQFSVDKTIAPSLLAADLKTGGYDRRTAMWMTQASHMAYAEPEAMAAWAQAAGCDDCRLVHDDRTRGRAYVLSKGDTAAVVFRGTVATEWANIATDLKILPDPRTGGHHGFQRATAALRPGIDENLADLGNKEIVVGGHSLGGAEAVHLGRSLRVEGVRQPIAVHTIGCPNVGTAAFNRGCEDLDLYHAQFGEDIVTRVPPQGLVGYRKKPGRLTRFDRQHRIQQDDTRPSEPTHLDRLERKAVKAGRDSPASSLLFGLGGLAVLRGTRRGDARTDLRKNLGDSLRRTFGARPGTMVVPELAMAVSDHGVHNYHQSFHRAVTEELKR